MLALWQHQALIDWWQLRSYKPPASIAALAETTTMTAEAKRWFYLGTPELNNKQEFSSNCPVRELEETLVLGCFSGGEIFILKVERSELKNVMPVTAAHEMLHFAYDRLGANERSRVDGLIADFYPQLRDRELNQLIKTYQRQEPGQLLNELHSLLPTQIGSLSPELEAYYRRYFKNRPQVARAFQKYQAVFNNIDQRRAALRRELSTLEQEINVTKATAEAAAARANSLSVQINSMRAQGRVEESNALVAEQNAAANQANAAITRYQNLVGSYNQKVQEINRLALLEADLVNSLDASRLTPVSPR